jgi:hypothetical protein
MQETGDVFRTGKYHKSFKKKHLHLIRKLQLRVFYQTSSRLINILGWPDPLAREAPRVLLCGTASPYTTVTFTRFVRKHNSAASIDVLDISPYAVSQSVLRKEIGQKDGLPLGNYPVRPSPLYAESRN